MLNKNTFSVEKAMQLVMCHKKTHEPAQPQKPTVDVDNIEITEDVLKHCTIKMAYIVQQDDTYLPIFRRLTEEREKLRQVNELREYALKIINDVTEL